MDISLRDLTTLEEFRQVVELEKLVWGCTYEDVVPVPILVITIKRGGVLIGAFDNAGEMVGFVYSIPGIRDGRLVQWSHMLGVLEPYRNSGLGRLLKLEQRARALAKGFDVIEWTFDPLQALNAHLNLRKLGVIIEEYEENIYGESSSPLHRGTPTDRFVAQWWLSSPRVESRLSPGNQDRSSARMGEGEPVVNVTKLGDTWRRCEAVDLSRSEPRLWVEIPTGFSEMQTKDPALALSWRYAAREIFTTYFPKGYRATEFVLERDERRGCYLLTREPVEQS